MTQQATLRKQAALGAGVTVLAVLLAVGASQIGGDAGYGGVSPAFLGWAVSGLLGGCGLLLLREAFTGGFRNRSDEGLESAAEAAEGGEPDAAPSEPAYWVGFAWLSAGMLLNAALITTLGFVLSCSLGFLCAVRGFRGSQGRAEPGVWPWVRDGLIGMAITGPVFWMFTKGLSINLPGLTATGWI